MSNSLEVLFNDGTESLINNVVDVEMNGDSIIVKTSTTVNKFVGVKSIKFKTVDGPGLIGKMTRMKPWNHDQAMLVNVSEIDAEVSSTGKEFSMRVLNGKRFGQNMAMDSFIDQTGLINFIIYEALWMRFRPDYFFKMVDALRRSFSEHETYLKPNDA